MDNGVTGSSADELRGVALPSRRELRAAEAAEAVAAAEARVQASARRAPLQPSQALPSQASPAEQRKPMSIRRRASGALAMAFVALLAVTVSVPAYAVNLDAAAPAAQNAASAQRAQSLKPIAGATITVQRDGYTSAAAPRPQAVAPSQTASMTTGMSRGWVLPEAGPIRSPFGARPNAPVAGVSPFHKGDDIAAACGVPVYAAAAGTIVEAGYKGSYGNWILIDHGNGIQTGYAHASVLLVSLGQHVAAGSRIALVGRTGSATGCHVHFETRIDGTPVNPVPFMSARGVRIG